MTDKTLPERAAFEDWATHPDNDWPVKREPFAPDTYRDPRTHAAWHAWQGRALLAAPPARPAPAEQPPATFWVTHNDDGDPTMLFFDRQEALKYDDAPKALVYASPARPAPAPAGEPWPEGAVFTDMEGGYYDENARPLAPPCTRCQRGAPATDAVLPSGNAGGAGGCPGSEHRAATGAVAQGHSVFICAAACEGGLT